MSCKHQRTIGFLLKTGVNGRAFKWKTGHISWLHNEIRSKFIYVTEVYQCNVSSSCYGTLSSVGWRRSEGLNSMRSKLIRCDSELLYCQNSLIDCLPFTYKWPVTFLISAMRRWPMQPELVCLWANDVFMLRILIYNSYNDVVHQVLYRNDDSYFCPFFKVHNFKPVKKLKLREIEQCAML